MSSSIQRDGWLRTSLVSMVWRRANTAFLPLLSSSTRARAREDGVDEEEGEGSGPNFLGGEGLGEEADEGEEMEVCSGEAGGFGNQVGSVNRPS